ncbi:putative perlucin 3 [Aphelenchoides fujianensis]|nr:putative perlucin 3 [Aphelenchoides fujianensis]
MASPRLVANSTSATHFALLSVVFLILSINTVAAKECPDRAIRGFEGYNTAPCYLFERFPTQFVTAERMCRYSGGHLASIEDGFVNAFVAQGGTEAFLIMEVDDFWIGGHDLHNQSTWEWTDDLTWNYTNWDKNQPSNVTTDRCLGMQIETGFKPYVCALGWGDHNTTATPIVHNGTTPLPARTTTHEFTTTIGQFTTSSAPVTLLTSASTPTIQWTSSSTPRATKTSTTPAHPPTTTRGLPTTTTSRPTSIIPIESSSSTVHGHTQTVSTSTTPAVQTTTPEVEEPTTGVTFIEPPTRTHAPPQEPTTEGPESTLVPSSPAPSTEQTSSSAAPSTSPIQTEPPVVTSSAAPASTVQSTTPKEITTDGPIETTTLPASSSTPEDRQTTTELPPSSGRPHASSSASPSTPEHPTTFETEEPVVSSSTSAAQTTTSQPEEPTTPEQPASSSPIPTESSSALPSTAGHTQSTTPEEITTDGIETTTTPVPSSSVPASSPLPPSTAGPHESSSAAPSTPEITTSEPEGPTSSISPSSAALEQPGAEHSGKHNARSTTTTPEVEEPTTGFTIIEPPTRTHAPPQEPTTEGPDSTRVPSSAAPSSESPIPTEGGSSSTASPSTRQETSTPIEEITSTLPVGTSSSRQPTSQATTLPTDAPIGSSSAAPSSTTPEWRSRPMPARRRPPPVPLLRALLKGPSRRPNCRLLRAARTRAAVPPRARRKPPLPSAISSSSQPPGPSEVPTIPTEEPIVSSSAAPLSTSTAGHEEPTTHFETDSPLVPSSFSAPDFCSLVRSAHNRANGQPHPDGGLLPPAVHSERGRNDDPGRPFEQQPVAVHLAIDAWRAGGHNRMEELRRRAYTSAQQSTSTASCLDSLKATTLPRSKPTARLFLLRSPAAQTSTTAPEEPTTGWFESTTTPAVSSSPSTSEQPGEFQPHPDGILFRPALDRRADDALRGRNEHSAVSFRAALTARPRPKNPQLKAALRRARLRSRPACPQNLLLRAAQPARKQQPRAEHARVDDPDGRSDPQLAADQPAALRSPPSRQAASRPLPPTLQTTTPEVEEPSTSFTIVEAPTRTHAPPQEPTTEGPESTLVPSSAAPSTEQTSSVAPSTSEIPTIQTETPLTTTREEEFTTDGPVETSSVSRQTTTELPPSTGLPHESSSASPSTIQTEPPIVTSTPAVQTTTAEPEEPTTEFFTESSTQAEPSTSSPAATSSEPATTTVEGQTSTPRTDDNPGANDPTDTCYWVMASEGWEADREACESMESSLVIVHNDMENSAVKLVAFQAPATKGKSDVSIGLHEVRVNGKRTWQWIDGSEVDVEKWYKGWPKKVKDSDPLRCGTYVEKDKNHLNVGLWKTTSCDGVQASAVCTQPPNFDISEGARSMMEVMRARQLQATQQENVTEAPLRAHRHLARQPAV